MAKTKKISVNAWENIVKENYVDTALVDWHGEELVIRTTLGLPEVMELVNRCADACFLDADHAYMPEKLPIAIKLSVISMYTNVTLPTNPNKLYDLLYRSDLFETVLDHINVQQFDEMCAAIDERISYRINANVEEASRRFEELYAALDQLGAQMESALAGVSSDDLKSIVGVIADGGIDEEKLVKSYIEQRGDAQDGKIVRADFK